MAIIYHVTTSRQWEQALKKGFYEVSSLQQEGFIHCSEEEQVNGVLQRYFGGQKGLVKLEIDTEKLTSRFVYEWSTTTQDTFPHIYGPINLDAVIAVKEIS